MKRAELLLYIMAAKAELDYVLGDLDKALEYIWRAYELADGSTKRLLKRAYDAINDGKPWEAKRLLEKAVGPPRCGPEEF
jgi:tetratricopeptide (TPR) repeat protein